MSVYYTPRHQNYNTVHMWKVFSKPYTLPSRHYHYTREYFRQYYASPIHLCTLLVVTNSPCSISFLPGTTVTHYSPILVTIVRVLYLSSQALFTLLSISGQYPARPVSFLPGTTTTLESVSSYYF